MDEIDNLREFYNKFKDEQACRDYLEQIRWKGNPSCPKCGSTKVYKFTNGKLFKCGGCRKQFTVRVGTIFEDSKLPLQKWFLIIHLTSSFEKGLSSVQASKYIGITQKSAWFLLQRIRFALEKGTYERISQKF